MGKCLAQSRCSVESSCGFERYKPPKLLAPCFPLLANGMLCAFEGCPGLFHTPEFIESNTPSIVTPPISQMAPKIPQPINGNINMGT